MGMHPLSSTQKSAFISNTNQRPSNEDHIIQSPATLGQVSVKGINAPSGADYDAQAAQA